MAAGYYSKFRIIQRFLPLLKSAKSLARVVVVAAGTYEGAVAVEDLACFKLPLPQVRPHFASMITLLLQEFAIEAPTVSFIHDFPGAVQSGLFDDLSGLFRFAAPVMKMSMWFGTRVGLPGFVSIQDTGERHVFLATSGAYKAKEGEELGVPLLEGLDVKQGIDGIVGGGVYSLDLNGESASLKVEKVVADLREKGVNGLIQKHTLGEIDRILAHDA